MCTLKKTSELGDPCKTSLALRVPRSHEDLCICFGFNRKRHPLASLGVSGSDQFQHQNKTQLKWPRSIWFHINIREGPRVLKTVQEPKCPKVQGCFGDIYIFFYFFCSAHFRSAQSLYFQAFLYNHESQKLIIFLT